MKKTTKNNIIAFYKHLFSRICESNPLSTYEARYGCITRNKNIISLL